MHAEAETEGRVSDEIQREHWCGLEVLLGPADIVQILGLSKPSQVYELTRLTSRSPLPFLRVGKYLRFEPTAVRQWLAANRDAPRARRAEEHRGRRAK